MKTKFLRGIFIIIFIFFGIISFAQAHTQTKEIDSLAKTTEVSLQKTTSTDLVKIFVFERKGCHFCYAEKKFLGKLASQRNDFQVIYFDVADTASKEKFNKIAKLYDLTRATPITLVGTSVIQGFNSEETTGSLITKQLDELDKVEKRFNFEDYLNPKGLSLSKTEATCDGEEDSTSCTVKVKRETEIKLPFIGVIDFKDFSLTSISVVLGFVDGFNPCAMWVLLAFLLVLWQVGDKKKMFQVAGLFILAETIMYWLILNFWFKAWDFVGLDKVVTPIVGIIAISGGFYFLYRYAKDRKKVTCDVTSIKYKSKTEEKIKKLITSPLTILTALGIIGIAFSVNIIEFACSIGIPQTFTKILEINHLSTFSQQVYILIYTFFYMIDDFVVFGLALYGFDQFYSIGQKYSNFSSLIGGILMIALGALLLFAPGSLVF